MVPGDLRIVVGMQIDESGGEGESVRVDLAFTRFADLSDGADPSAADRDVRPSRFVAEAVDDRRTTDDELIHELPSRVPLTGPRA